MKIAVAGGTGMIGRRLVDVLTRRGDTPVVLARSHGVDLLTGQGVAAALDGCTAVVDVTNVATARRGPAVDFFSTVAGHLWGGAAVAGVRHALVLSIVGADRVDYGYYLGKRRQEELLAGSGLGWTLLRATQFHEFAGQILTTAALGPLVVLPRMLSRPVSVEEVAVHLADLAHAGPQGVVTPMAGPQTLRLADMVRGHLHVTGRRRPVLEVRFPGRVGAAVAAGALVPDGPAVLGRVTFEDYLAGLRGPVADR